MMRLEEPKQLYGRDEELREMNAFLLNGVVQPGAATRSCVVRGKAGHGKTALCENVASASLFCHSDPNINDAMAHHHSHQSGHRGYFLRGKLEQQQHTSSSQGALVQAFESLARQLRPEDEEDLQACLSSYEASLICRAIPSFRKLFQQHSSRPGFARVLQGQQPAGEPSSQSSPLLLNRTSERLAVALRALLRGFCRPHRPVVLFIDDLQWLWTNKDSRETLLSLLKDSQIENFCFLGAHRDEDCDEDTETCFLLDILLGQDNINTLQHLEIRLENLTLESVNAIASNMLHSESTLPLARVIHQKTAGNPFFVIQFAKSLCNKELLRYNFATNQWEWEDNAVEAETDITDNVVDVVRGRIRSLDPTVGWILALAAHLGYQFNVQLLESLNGCSGLLSLATRGGHQNNNSSSFVMSLEIAQQQGLVECSTNTDGLSSSTWKFAHDKVQQSMYELVPPGAQRDELHQRIGRHVYDNYCSNNKSAESSSKWLLVAADQLNRGSSAIAAETEKDRLFLIQLNYDAAQAAKKRAGTTLVADLLSKATALTKAGDWEHSYDLILEIYSWSAEVEFSRGNFEECSNIITSVLKHAQTQEDTLRALIVNMEMHGAQRKFGQAIKECRNITGILGERLPSSSTFNIVVHLLKINRKVKNKDDAYFVQLKDTTMPKYKYLLDVLYKASVYGWSKDPNFTGLCLLRMMEISLKNGVSEHTGLCYAGYGYVLGATGDPKGAYRFGKLGLQISRGKSGYLATVLSVYTSLYHFYEPAANGMEPMLEAYRIGLATGDMFYGSLCLSCYTCLYLFCGLPLDHLVKDGRKFGGELKVCHQDFALSYVIAQFQLALNLTGQSGDPLDCSQGALKKHDFFSANLSLDADDAFYITLDYFQAFNAILLDDIRKAETTLQRIMSRKTRRLSGSHFFNYFFMLVDVIVGSAIWRRESKRPFRKLVENATKELRGCMKMGIMNCLGILSIAEAELAEIRNKSDSEVKVMYDTAISILTRTGFVHFAGIANELAGERMLRLNDQYWVDHYLSNALGCYEEWGAKVKVQQLREKHDFTEPKGPGCRRSAQGRSSIRGRVRYDSAVDAIGAEGSSAFLFSPNASGGSAPR